jgi:hypothetical protein
MSIKDLMTSGVLAPQPKVQAATPDASAGAVRADIPIPAPVKPERTNSAQVVFKSRRPSFGFMYKEVRYSFSFGHYMTDDTNVIKHIKDNFVPNLVVVVEEGPLE